MECKGLPGEMNDGFEQSRAIKSSVAARYVQNGFSIIVFVLIGVPSF